jgi:ATP-dependent DNA helicase RecG
MNAEELINKGESETLEFKTSLSLKDEIGACVSAFSNTSGGIILIGVTDKGGVVGVGIGANTIENVASYIKRHTDPQIFPSINVLEIDGKNIIAVEVDESNDKPVFFKKYAHKRVGKSSQRMSSSEMRKLAHEDVPNLPWDAKICGDASLDDIDEKKVRWFLKEAKKQRDWI